MKEMSRNIKQAIEMLLKLCCASKWRPFRYPQHRKRISWCRVMIKDPKEKGKENDLSSLTIKIFFCIIVKYFLHLLIPI
jgi:hypothetical protein